MLPAEAQPTGTPKALRLLCPLGRRAAPARAGGREPGRLLVASAVAGELDHVGPARLLQVHHAAALGGGGRRSPAGTCGGGTRRPTPRSSDPRPTTPRQRPRRLTTSRPGRADPGRAGGPATASFGSFHESACPQTSRPADDVQAGRPDRANRFGAVAFDESRAKASRSASQGPFGRGAVAAVECRYVLRPSCTTLPPAMRAAADAGYNGRAMAAAQTVSFSPLILLTLLVVLAASSAMFWLLSWRATSRRWWVALAEWGGRRGFTSGRWRCWVPRRPSTSCPGPAAECAAVPDQRPDDPDAVPDRPGVAAGRGRRRKWPRRTSISRVRPRPDVIRRVAGGLVRRGGCGGDFAPRRLACADPPGRRGLEADRPSARRRGGQRRWILFSLCSFPRLGDAGAVRGLRHRLRRRPRGGESFARALLPHDVGLLLHGRFLVLDFSDRPFDTIEFNRMLALADQVAGYVGMLNNDC